MTQPSTRSGDMPVPNKKVPKKTIVLLDDSPVMSKKYGNGLRNAGFLVAEYNDAKEFFDLTQNGGIPEPDMFVIDVVIERGDHAFGAAETDGGTLEGIRIAQALRDTQAYGSVPIVLLSGWPSRDVLQAAAVAANAAANKNACDCIFVQKQKYSAEDLARLVDKFFRNNRFPRSKWIQRIVLQLPVFPFLKIEFEPHK